MPTRKFAYDTSVFINCPFDPAYTPLFRALVFTIEFCGFSSRCALEIDDSGESRANKIIRLIQGSRLGIHDISRTELTAQELPRFNMPYEFGLFVGLKNSHETKQRRKVVLVLDREPYRYQRFLSDIAGQDIRSHGDSPKRLIQETRNWLQNQAGRNLMGGDYIHRQFQAFQRDLPALLDQLHKTQEDLNNYIDYHSLVVSWLATAVGE